jgi:hypothetical protein
LADPMLALQETRRVPRLDGNRSTITWTTWA